MLGLVLLVGLVVLIARHRSQAKHAELEARRAWLMSKYGDKAIVTKIMAPTLWVGETTEQLRDSIGAPVDIDQKVLKTKTKETWKYGQRGPNRFALRITVENGTVVGWDEKI